MRNRFKGLDLIDRMPDELWTEICDIVQETGSKSIPKKKQCKTAKQLSEEALQIAAKRREAKSKGEKERYTRLYAEFQRTARRDKKAFLSDHCKEIEEKQNGKDQRSLQENQRYQGNISCKDVLNKGQKLYGPNRTEDIKKKWQEYTEELYKKDLQDPDNHEGVITQSQTSWNVKSSGPQKASLQTKLVEVMEFQLSYFKSRKMGEEPRWRRSRTGRTLSPPQIHQKSI